MLPLKKGSGRFRNMQRNSVTSANESKQDFHLPAQNGKASNELATCLQLWACCGAASAPLGCFGGPGCPRPAALPVACTRTTSWNQSTHHPLSLPVRFRRSRTPRTVPKWHTEAYRLPSIPPPPPLPKQHGGKGGIRWGNGGAVPSWNRLSGMNTKEHGRREEIRYSEVGLPRKNGHRNCVIH